MAWSTDMSAPERPRIAFVGLGNMGGHMARHIINAGYETVIADLDPAKVRALVDAGATAADSAVDAARNADIVFTSLPGPKQVRHVGLDMLAIMPPGATWIDLSTNDLTCAREIAAVAATAGVDLLDAPVTGGAEGAEAGTLTVLVGGDATTYERCRPVLTCIGERIDLLGPHGAGYVAKIAQVSLCYLHSVCLTEALLLGVKGGVEPNKMLDIVRSSTGRSYVADLYGPEILNGGYDDTFALELAAKDLRLAMDLAADVGAELPFMGDVSAFYDRAVEDFGPEAPHLIAVQNIERRNDLILHEVATSTSEETQ